MKSLWDAENADRSAEEFIAYALAAQPRLRRAALWYIVRGTESEVWATWWRRAKRGDCGACVGLAITPWFRGLAGPAVALLRRCVPIS